MAYGKSKDLVKRTHSDKVLRDKAFKIAKKFKEDFSAETISNFTRIGFTAGNEKSSAKIIFPFLFVYVTSGFATKRHPHSDLHFA